MMRTQRDVIEVLPSRAVVRSGWTGKGERGRSQIARIGKRDREGAAGGNETDATSNSTADGGELTTQALQGAGVLRLFKLKHHNRCTWDNT
eukprot:4356385-Pyramimonas_sp.AAC.1